MPWDPSGAAGCFRAIFGSISSGMQVFTGPLSWSHRKDRLMVLDIDADRIAAMASQGTWRTAISTPCSWRASMWSVCCAKARYTPTGPNCAASTCTCRPSVQGRAGGVETPACPIPGGSHFDELAPIGRVTGIGEPGGSEVAGTVERFELLLQGLDLDSAAIASRPLVAEHAHLVLNGWTCACRARRAHWPYVGWWPTPAAATWSSPEEPISATRMAG